MANVKTKTKTTRKPAAKAAPKNTPAVKPAPPVKDTTKRKSVWNASNQRAMYSTSKSGYAKDLAGSRVDSDERAGLAVPVATEHGRQEGRLAPAQRRYGVARYAAVSATQAQDNMMKRLRGEMPPIEGGLDYEIPLDETDDDMNNADFDPLGDINDDFEPGSPELEAEEKKLAESMAVPSSRPLFRDAKAHAAPVQSNGYQEFIDRRCRLTLELVDGAMSVAAIAVKESKYGITILLPLLDDGATFIPKPGSEITIVFGDRRWPCFFPGTYFECPELKLLGIVFVKAEEG